VRPLTDPTALLQEMVGGQAGPRVVAIGGGHGLAQALRAVTQYAGVTHAVVTVADDGGSSGRLAPALSIPPPGDIRQCLIALTPEDTVWRRLFQYRFDGADVVGHSLGNLIIASLADLEGDFEAALRASERLLGSVGSVVPASPQRLDLEAIVDGTPVSGQVNISSAKGSIESLRLTPSDAEASESALDAIAAADQIVLGPGSLFTSVIATLLVPGLTEEINKSDAQVVYVSNIITQDAETLGMDCAEHLEALLSFPGLRSPTAIVANSAPVQVAAPLEALDADPEVMQTYGVDTITADLLDRNAEWPRHDPVKLGEVLRQLISHD
jgi:uncharacterized cofD-like protein